MHHKDISITVANDERHGIHEEEGIPTMYFDQLTTIANHLNEIKRDDKISQPSLKYVEGEQHHITPDGIIHAIKGILPKNRRRSTRLTRRKLKNQDDWLEWQAAERTQLDQYEEQDTFSAPC